MKRKSRIAGIALLLLILEAVHQGNIVGTQGKKNPRTIYDFIYNGNPVKKNSKASHILPKEDN